MALSSLIAPITVSFSTLFHFLLLISVDMSFKDAFCLCDPRRFVFKSLAGNRPQYHCNAARFACSELRNMLRMPFVCLRVEVFFVLFRRLLNGV